MTYCARIEQEVQILYTLSEWDAVQRVALERQTMNVAAGLRQKYGASNAHEASLHLHELGCFGEHALCWHLELPWTSAYDRQAKADVGTIYQVRAVDEAKKANRSLSAHPSDPSDQVFVLAVVNYASLIVTLKGWAYGYDVKDRGLWRFRIRRPCYMLHESSPINPMGDLPREP